MLHGFSERPVHRGGGLAIGCIRFFNRIKRAEVLPYAVDFYSRNEFAAFLVEASSLVARGVVNLWSSVAEIFRCGGRAKVLPSVIQTIAVNVVYLVLWPLSSDDEPYNAVSHVVGAVYPDFSSHRFAGTIDPPSGFSERSSFPGLYAVMKIARLRVVGKYFSRPLNRQVESSAFMTSFHGSLIRFKSYHVNGVPA